MTTLVVVDPMSTGAILCRVAASRGFRVITLWSHESSATVRHQSLFSDAITFASASVEEEESLEATVKALKSQVKSDEWLECIPGSEWGVQLAERVCCALKLRGNGSFLDRRNKELQRQALETADLRVMRQVCGVDFEEARKGLELAGLSLPLVLKPVQSSGTDGVKLCRSWHEVKEHFHELRCTKSRVSVWANSGVLCQELLEGPEYVVDQISRDGQHKTIMVWRYDKGQANGQDFVYRSMQPVSPSDYPPGLLSYTRSALDALHFRNGATHAEVIMTAQGPCLVEMNVRLMGAGGCFVKLSRALTGTSHVDAALDGLESELFGLLPDVPKAFEADRGLIIFLTSYVSGTVLAVDFGQLRSLPSFMELHTKISVGSVIQKTVNTSSFAGILVLSGTREQIKADALKVREIEQGLFTCQMTEPTLHEI